MTKLHKDSPKITRKGTELPLIDLQGKPYLQVAHRIVWYREEHPNGDIQTEPIQITEDYAIFKTVIYDAEGKRLSSGHKKETQCGFGDFIEKAETGAIGRALALAGFGTQFEPELDEGDRLADSPIPIAKKNKEQGSTVYQKNEIKQTQVEAYPTFLVNSPTIEGNQTPPTSEVEAAKKLIRAKCKSHIAGNKETKESFVDRYIKPFGVFLVADLPENKLNLCISGIEAVEKTWEIKEKK